MADALTLYTNPWSRGQIARWALEEAGADYDTVILAYGDEMKSADYLAINPMGKVPAIVHGDQVVTEAAAICAYLADAFPDAGLAPQDHERGAYYRWLFFAAGPVEYGIALKTFDWSPTEEQERMVGHGTYDLMVDTLEKAVSGSDYLCGDRFTAADIYLGAAIDWATSFGTLPKRAAFDAYADRLRDRPAYQRAKGIDNALIAEMQAAS